MFISIQQVKAARALLDWTQEDLAAHAGIDVNRLRGFESGRTKPLEVVEAVHEAFSQRGIVFVDDGVHRRKHQIRVLEGQKGFWDFYDDVYETVRAQGGDILISGVTDAQFRKWHGERGAFHIARMKELNNFQQKIILQKGGTHVPPVYKTTEYRFLNANQFPDAPFYVYGNKLAIISFHDEDVTVFIMEERKIAAAYSKIFFTLWEICGKA